LIAPPTTSKRIARRNPQQARCPNQLFIQRVEIRSTLISGNGEMQRISTAKPGPVFLQQFGRNAEICCPGHQ